MSQSVNLINERLKHLLKILNIMPSQFADSMGVPRATISHLLAGRNKPSIDFINKLHETYPHININWLLFGELPIFRNAQKDETNQILPSFPVSDYEKITGKRIDKIIIFYSDQTFELFHASLERHDSSNALYKK
jgi:transcriptional regulator with XRE-family HTH domain